MVRQATTSMCVLVALALLGCQKSERQIIKEKICAEDAVRVQQLRLNKIFDQAQVQLMASETYGCDSDAFRAERAALLADACGERLATAEELRSRMKFEEARSELDAGAALERCDELPGYLTTRAANNLDRIDAERKEGRVSQQTAEPPANGPELGPKIAVPSDAKAAYHVVSMARRSDGLTEIVTRRSGTSGQSYSRRIINCSSMTFAYAGEGDSWSEFNAASDKPYRLGPLTDGSISTYVAQYACANAKR